MTHTGTAIGVGETILDIIVRNTSQTVSVPGGSAFNTAISLSRSGVPTLFAGYAGADAVGRHILNFLRSEGIDTRCFALRPDVQSAISLAYLDERGDADYTFYKFSPSLPQQWRRPEARCGDVVVLGSYFAIAPGTRQHIGQMLAQASEAKAAVYYDLNYRQSHAAELTALLPTIERNKQLSTIVRGRADDFPIMYGLRGAQEIYDQHVAPHCPTFICTAAEGDVVVCTPRGTLRFAVPPVKNIVSTVGAGDNFNAGVVSALLTEGHTAADVAELSAQQWATVIGRGIEFAAEACQRSENYIARRT